MSLQLRLLITLVPLFIAGLVAADVGTHAALQSYLLSRLDDQLLSGHPAVEEALERGSAGGGPGGPGGQPVSTSLPTGTYGELLTTDGAVVNSGVVGFGPQGAPSSTTHPVLPSSLHPGTAESPVYITVNGTGTVNRYRAYVETASNGDILVLAAPLDDIDSILARLTYLEIGVTGGVTLIVVLASWLVVRKGLRPLERMGRTARSIVASDLSKRVTPANEKTEVGRLGLALNTMLAQLEAAFAERAANEQRLRHFVSDASHELRTPLTSMRGYAELLRHNPDMDREDIVLAMRRLEDESKRMGILVDDLLLLARLDQGRPLDHGPVDLEALVVDACADARAVAPGRTISSRVSAPLVLDGDELRLRQALANLMRNAVVHTPVGTPIDVELHADGVHAVLEVIDHGSGIPAGHADRIFERFHRANPERSGDQGGSGLGLSIAAAIVAAHGGRLTVGETPGGGATFRVELPLPAAPPAATSRAGDSVEVRRS
ncbi:MAG: HAMP domain-containing histidine kinase [Chloroflexi bacterium]|nr:MAG: HAMP domain-containing histidine kinase [Chloroflexota bacterium]